MEDNNSYKQMDDLIRSRFENAEEAPSLSTWDNIENRLDEKGKKRPGFIFWFSGILLLLICAGTFCYVKQNEELEKGLAAADKGTYAANKKVNHKTIEERKTAGTEISKKDESDTIQATGNKEVKINSGENKTPKEYASVNERQEAEKKEKAPEKSNTPDVAGKNNIVQSAKSDYKQPDPFPEVNIPSAAKAAIAKNISSKNSGLKNSKEESSKEILNPFIPVNTASDKEGNSVSTGTELQGDKGKALTPQAGAGNNKKEINSIAATAGTKNDTAGNFLLSAQSASAKTNKTDEDKKVKLEEEAKQAAADKTAAEQKAIVAEATKKDSLAIADGKKGDKDSSLVKKDSVKNMTATTATPVADSTKAKADKLKWILSVYYSPDYYQNKVKDNSGQFAGNEKQSNRFSTGFKLTYVLLDKLSVRLGVSYSELKQSLGDHQIVFDRYQTDPFVFHSSLGDMPVDMATMKDGFSPMAPAFITQFRMDYHYKQSVQFINIPLELKFGLNFKYFGVSVLAGVTAQYAYHSHAELILQKESNYNSVIYNKLDINKMSYSGTGGLSFDINLSKRLSLFLEPNARMNFTPLGKSSGVSSKAIFYGVNGGIGFHF